MRRAVLSSAAAMLLVGPTVLAFFSGGYFDGARLVAAFAAWVLVVVVALASPRPLPTSWPGRAALAGLALIAAWTGLSLAWAPLSGPATDNFVRLLVYVGTLIAAMSLLRETPMSRAVEPLLALGAVVVIGYGLAGRLLPGLVHLSQSRTAQGRLEQPITYWNAEGALAAIGLLLCARLAGDRSRAVLVRALAAAGSAPLGAGVYLSYSRGAIAAAILGVTVLLAAAPSWSQLRGLGISLAAGVVAASASAATAGVSSLEGGLAAREREGVIVLCILLAVMVAAAVMQAWSAVAERGERMIVGQFPWARHLRALSALALVLGLAGLVAGGLDERPGKSELVRSPGAQRLISVKSQRYDYWRIGLRAFRRHPFKGLGSGGFRVAWLKERPLPGSALEVHSLPLEMATELGLPGLLSLVLLLTGVGAGAHRSLARGAGVAPGASAATTVWFVHAAIDWDWQIPAVTLPALILAGALIGASEEDPQSEVS